MTPGETTPPTHGPNGSPVVSSSVTWDRPVEFLRYLPPERPERVLWVYDFYGDLVGERTLTDAEYADATRRYERAVKRYRATGGRVMVPGPESVSCSVTCEDGSRAEYNLAGSEWRCVAFMPVPP